MDAFRQFLEDRLAKTATSPSRLAESSGVPASIISRWLRAQKPARPSPANLEKLAPALGVAYEDLMRMCGYLPGVARPGQPDPVEQAIRARKGDMREALRGIPQEFWATIIRKTFDQAIGGVRDAADLARELARVVPAPPVKSPDGGPVERPDGLPNTPPAAPDPDFRAREAAVNPSGAGLVPRHAPVRNLSMVAVARP